MGKKISVDSSTLINKIYELIEAKKIFKDNGTTAIIVSHDFEDAIAMSDHVLIIDEGSVTQKGPAKDIAVIPRKNSFKIA